MRSPILSIVMPVYNESGALADFHKSLIRVIQRSIKDPYEIIYCDDGSTDSTAEMINRWHKKNPSVNLIKLTRNFGKEIATTAGIHEASGEAILTLDADGQHPPELIPEFIKRWQSGSKLVIGLRRMNQSEGFVKRFGSKLFYKLFNKLSGVHLIPGSTDFRLIDRTIQREFIRLTERQRITRGLIDWLGYEPDYIEFKASPRLSGRSGYSFKKLVKLAIDSVISMSLSPLYITAYIGAVVLPSSLVLGILMFINLAAGDPLGLHATASAYLIVLILFLVGILLISQGIIGLYLSHIHTETQNRPLYIIDRQASTNFNEN